MNSQNQQSVKFIVTGFGPFRDSKRNPTSTIAQRIVSYLQEKGEHDIANSTSSMVVEVSADAARRQVDAIFEEIWSTNGIGHTPFHQTVVLLHLGVNYKGEKFQLESFAYNEADFRIPDERKFQPKHEPIIKGVALGEPLRTHFDIPSLVKELYRLRCNDCDATKAMISIDPGRFVCNYIYYHSLNKCRSGPRFPSVRCMFLHVPPLAVFCETEQLDFVVNLMVAMKRQVDCDPTLGNDGTPPLLRGADL